MIYKTLLIIVFNTKQDLTTKITYNNTLNMNIAASILIHGAILVLRVSCIFTILRD